MTDVIISAEEFEALRALRQAATELVTGIPYVTMAGGNITRQNILVQALSAALEATRDVDFANAREYVKVPASRKSVNSGTQRGERDAFTNPVGTRTTKG